jgi:hypothetical protein
MDEKTRAYNAKILTELQEAKARLEELEARSKAEDEQVALDLINQLKSTCQKVEKQREGLTTSAVEEMDEEKAEIDAGLAKLRTGLLEIDTRLKRKAA